MLRKLWHFVKKLVLKEEYFMEKREYKIGIELTDKQWKKIAPLLPEPEQSAKGGQVPASNRACLEGVLWLLRSGARYKDVPKHFPSGSNCWRRLKWWYEQGALLKAWQKILGMLDQKGRLRWDECFADGTFSPSKKGAKPSEKRKKERERK
jgi:transposase